MESAPATVNLSQQVYEQIRGRILTCEFAPGEIVSEGSLASRFDVSKTPIREALVQLSSEGLVVALPRLGYQVAPITVRDVSELFELREIVEGSAIELACDRIEDLELQELRDFLETSHVASEDLDGASVVRLNRQFHHRLAATSKNSRLVQIVDRLLDDLERVFYLGASIRNISREVKQEHQEILEAVATGDAERARQLMINHTRQTQEGILEQFNQLGNSARGIMRLE